MDFSGNRYTRFNGAISSYRQEGQSVIFQSGPLSLSLTVLASNLLRVRYAPQGSFKPRRSWAVTRPDEAFSAVSFKVEETSDAINLVTEKLHVRLERATMRLTIAETSGRILCEDAQAGGFASGASGEIAAYKVMPDNEYYYGFGERTSLSNKRGRRYQNWTRDPVDTDLDHGPGADNLYQAIPFFMALQPDTGGYGLYLNNSYRSGFDMGWMRDGTFSFGAIGGELDYYFIYGPEPAAIVEGYTNVTNRAPLPPRWSLGYQQCRWSYFPESTVTNIATQLRARRIPTDTIVLDIDYMNGYRVFSWDRNHFPDPKELNQELAAQGFKMVTIVDPGVKHEPGGDYKVFSEGEAKNYFIKNTDGSLFTGYVWPGLSVFPDFARADVREWWGKQHKALLDNGVRGIWNDMNEPSISSHPFGAENSHYIYPQMEATQGSSEEGGTHAELHNMFGYLMDRSTYEGLLKLRPEERPFVLTRSGFAGIQQYAAVWMGDNSSLWEHLEMSMAQLCGMGLSGVPFVGVDIGGFWGSGSPELFARWIELGAFYPFSRGHSADGTPQKEPWVWGEEVEAITRKYLELRYRFLPYLYTLFDENSRTGAPVFRPMLYHFWQDSNTRELDDQVMLGESLMLAPIYRPATYHRPVYLPAGIWYDWWSGQRYENQQGQTILQAAPLDFMPMYVRGGSILPLGPVMQYTDEKPLDRLTLEIFPDAQNQATGQLYEDDGISFAYREGQFCRTRYTCQFSGSGQSIITAQREGAYQPAPRSIELRLHLPDGSSKTAELANDSGNWQIEIS